MTNLLGPEHIIEVEGGATITIPETAFVGEQGYVRQLVSLPQLGLTSNGNVNYRQLNTETPPHAFAWTIVLDEELAQQLIAIIESQILDYKNNNARNVPTVTLRDRKLATLATSVPASYTTEAIDDFWVFASWPIIFQSINFENYGNEKLILNITAEQAF